MEFPAMDTFCGSKFWDENLTWNTNNPDFTDCFKKTVLVWIPAAFLWIFCPLEIYRIRRITNLSYSHSWLFVAKLVLSLGLILLSIVDLGMALHASEYEKLYYVDYCTPIIKILSFSLAAVLLLFNRKHHIYSSGILFVFWLLIVVCEIPRFRTSVLDFNALYDPNYQVVSNFVYYPMIVVVFLCNFFADVKRESTKESKVNPSPEQYASFPSDIFFTWFDALAWKGFKNPLKWDDLWSLRTEDTANELVTTFDQHWKHTSQSARGPSKFKAWGRKLIRKEVHDVSSKNVPVSLLPALWKMFGMTIFIGGLYKLASDMLTLAAPLIMKLLMSLNPEDELRWRGYMYAVLLVVIKIIGTLFSTQYTNMMFLVGLRIRTTLTTAIYRKALRRTNTNNGEFAIGEISNLMSVDTQTIMKMCTLLHGLWTAPLQIILVCCFLWNILGISALAGFLIIILILPVHLWMTQRLMSLRVLQMQKKDARIRWINEMLMGIKVLKLYAWELFFDKKIREIRKEEVDVLRRSEFYMGFIELCFMCVPSVVCLVALATYSLSDDTHVLGADKVFVSLTLFNILQLPMLGMSESTGFLAQAIVAVKRINKFMNADEIDPNNVHHDDSGPCSLMIKGGKFNWSTGECNTLVLRNIDLQIERGQLVAVVGSVGAGKSSLLSALLGEMNQLGGRVNTKGTISYVSQQAFIQNATVRDNILFGNAYDEESYNRVLDACALLPDLKILPAGDRTEIGEKGINLSGGQKQRISMARAAYSGMDIYLMDDPLSAVDSHVGKHIFQHVIGPTGILKAKTRVLVTHGIGYLPQVDDILVLKDGQITERGNYDELIEKKGAFAEFLMQHVQELDQDQMIGDCADYTTDSRRVSSFGTENNLSTKPGDTSSELGLRTDFEFNSNSRTSILRQRYISKSDKDDVGEISVVQPVVGGQCVEDEHLEEGKVQWSVYGYYIGAIGLLVSITSIVSKALGEALTVGVNVWLTVWTNDKTTLINGVQDPSTRNMYLGVYSGLQLGTILFSLFSIIAAVIGGIRSCKHLHDNLLRAILQAPVFFFDVTPSGRILNRFGRDFDTLDILLPRGLRLFVFTVIAVLFMMGVIASSSPYFLLVIIPLGVIYYFTRTIYLATTRQLKRLESVSRSPMYCYFTESISGAETIRAYGAQERFIHELEGKVDVNQSCSYINTAADQWLCVRLEMIANCVVFFSALFAVLQRDTMSAGHVGLSLTYSLSITCFLHWLVRISAEVETNIVSVERVKEYSEIQPEAPWEIPECDTDEKWPCEGRIEFRDYKVRYREGLNLVLDGVSFIVHGGEKVGIVGRTGAGKSSLTLAIFRIIEAAGGQILIDDVDIATIGLQKLRSKLTIIPQDPMLFSGNLRMNLDPFDAHDDEEIWQALDHAHMKSFVQGLNGGLTYEITEGGSNFSVGQRQLICLTRALLRKTKILVLDEATASVDMETDEFIQRTIREEFKDCTVLTIAHRLNTILDSDKVIVLENGQVVEYDSPATMLQMKSSQFYSMAKDAGLVA